ncbi:DUF3168 domain-containing protein [Rubellimicrobium aerolatum]|uniref:DUF3168 domain-containing protein n=1 Tax=Rubellimicrobium aerolatum TaxID=490979 RepID=A0ABW0SB88_9RHOB|nr:DUF3168 domain-containing protein [Rubellimicrobium aerolatum]MBP1805510.1 hypothetical protein [Rubellimicrobium aerolatum]
MTYALSRAVQAALYQRLATDAPLRALVGDAVHDQLPPGLPPSLYVALGPETVRDRSDQTGRGSEHDVTLSVVSDGAGFADAKAAASAVCDALLGADLTLTRGRVVFLRFLRAQASRRDNGDTRRIDLIFRLRVEDDAASLT